MRNMRNTAVDYIRGFAMCLVVFTHTAEWTSVGYEQSKLFQYAWVTQMPLFFAISGYCSNYSDNSATLSSQIGKKTIQLLVPFCIWTWGIRGLVLGMWKYFDLKTFLYQLDSSYWFLISLFILSVVGILSNKAASKISGLIKTNKEDTYRIIIKFTLYFTFVGLIYLFGVIVGSEFMAIKQTIYYSLFYAFGMLLNCSLVNRTKREKCTDAAFCIGLFILIILINHYDFTVGSKGILLICFNVIAAFCGCIITADVIRKLDPVLNNNTIGHCLSYVGRHTLELYLIHPFLVGLISKETIYDYSTAQGVIVVFMNVGITIAISSLCVFIISKYKHLNLFLFGKKTSQR